MDWFPHDIEAYDTDTLHLTAFEDGVYHRLLRWYYKHERSLPADDINLAAIARIGMLEWGPISSRIRNFFETRVSRVTNVATLHQKRCNAYILKQNAKRRDGKARQEKFRKNNMLGNEYDVSRVTNAADRNRIGVEETQSLLSLSEIKTTTEPVDRGVQGVEISTPAAPEKLAKISKPRKPKTIRTRLPEGWVPSERNRAYAIDTGLDHSQIDAIGIRYARYWTGADAKNPTKADWDRTWENWVDREIQNGALVRNGQGGSQGHNGSRVGWVARVAQGLTGRGNPDNLPGERDQGGIHPVYAETPPEPPRKRPGAISSPDPGETIVEPDDDGRSQTAPDAAESEDAFPF